jgi:hypothetical protein
MKKNLGNLGLAAVVLSSLCLTLVGCGMGSVSSTAAPPVGGQTSGSKMQGKVFGGQQPLINARVYLYAATTSGYGVGYPYANGATSLLGSNQVFTDVNGNFNLSGLYTCPSDSTAVYLEAVGGTPDTVLADNNPNVIMMVALGPCGAASQDSFITMNELTTVASAYALAPFMTGPSAIGTSPGNAVGLANAFASVNKLVNVQYGQVNVTTVPAGATIPVAKLNTLADILASCVNTPKGGVAGDNMTACGTLFTDATTPANAVPTDTLTAILNIAHYPGQHVMSLATLASRTSPFQDIETSIPTDWTLSIRYTSTMNAPGAIAADQSGDLWIINNGNNSIVQFDPTGAPSGPFLIGSVYAGPLAVDLNGNAWISSSSSGVLLETNAAGNFGSVTGGGLGTTTTSLAIDGSGNLWAAGSGTKLSEFSTTTAMPISTTGYSGGGLSAAKSIAITSH